MFNCGLSIFNKRILLACDRWTDRQTDRRTDRQNCDFQDRASAAASRGNKIIKMRDFVHWSPPSFSRMSSRMSSQWVLVIHELSNWQTVLKSKPIWPPFTGLLEHVRPISLLCPTIPLCCALLSHCVCFRVYLINGCLSKCHARYCYCDGMLIRCDNVRSSVSIVSLVKLDSAN